MFHIFTCSKSSFLSLSLLLFPLQVKIWFQNRRTKWKKQDNISNTEAAEHKTSNTTKSGHSRDIDTKSNCTSSPPPDSPSPSQSAHMHHSTPLSSISSKQINASAKYKQKLPRDDALFKTQSPAAAAAYLPHHNPLFSMMAGHHHHHHLGLDHLSQNDVEARLAASKISLSAFSKVGEGHGMELSPMLSIGAMRLPRP